MIKGSGKPLPFIIIHPKEKGTYKPLSYSNHKPLPIPKHSTAPACRRDNAEGSLRECCRRLFAVCRSACPWLWHSPLQRTASLCLKALSINRMFIVSRSGRRCFSFPGWLSKRRVSAIISNHSCFRRHSHGHTKRKLSFPETAFFPL